jgi:hypothetical protein
MILITTGHQAFLENTIGEILGWHLWVAGLVACMSLLGRRYENFE